MRGSTDAAATPAAAAARRATCQSDLDAARELFMYACEIKETTNGSRGCACGEAR